MKTKEQLELCRVKPSPTAMAATAALVGYEGGEGLLTPQYIEDEHGVYSTGMFHYKGKQIIITIDDGLWHLSASSNHTLSYYELKELRYEFMPDNMTVAQIFPRRESFVNLHENCFHLWQLRPGAYSEEPEK